MRQEIKIVRALTLVGIARHHQNLHVGIILGRLERERNTIKLGHDDIGQQQVIATLGQFFERDTKTLSMSAQLSNISPTAQPYPALKATAYGPYGALIKTWNLPAPADGRTLASGEDAPIRAEFKDVPDAAAKLELRVTQP